MRRRARRVRSPRSLREWGRIGAARLRRPARARRAAARSDRRAPRLDRRARVRGRLRRLQPAARAGARRSWRSTARSGSAGPPGALVGGLAFILPGLVADRWRSPRSRSATRRRPGSRAFGAGAGGGGRRGRRPGRRSTLELASPAARARAVYVVAGALGGDRSPARSSCSCCSLRAARARPGAARRPRARLAGRARLAAALPCWLDGVQGRRALLRRRLRDHPADARRRGRAHGWMTEPEFANAVAYGQLTPGPVTHTVALVGYAAAGLGGALRRHRDRVRAVASRWSCSAAPLRAPARQPRRARVPRRRRPGRGRARSSAPPCRSLARARRARGSGVVLAAAALAAARPRAAARRCSVARRAASALAATL